MSEQPAQSESGPSDKKTSRGAGRRASRRAPKPPRRGGLLASIALILALLALAVVIVGGWQWWQQRDARQADAQTAAQLRQQVAAMQSTLRKTGASRQQDQRALKTANQALQQRVAGMSERVDSLEAAVASLAQHSQQGRRAVLLDQAEMLLRMGQERYTLFHDAAGALNAYTQAAHVLAGVDDPAFAGVRRTVDAARSALAAAHPMTREADLATLAHLRGVVAQLPLKRRDAAAAKTAPQGFWQRVWHALSTAVVVRRVDDSPQDSAATRLTRQLATLDVAQAEAARLAWDGPASRAALERVAQSLATAFDTHDATVRKAQATVKRLLAASPSTDKRLDLGKALQQLQSVRAVRGIKPTEDEDASPARPHSAPSPATSTAPAGAAA